MGNYMVDIANEIIAEYGNKFQRLTEAEALAQLGDIGIKKSSIKFKRPETAACGIRCLVP